VTFVLFFQELEKVLQNKHTFMIVNRWGRRRRRRRRRIYSYSMIL
jgi:hypothetical protein